MSGLMMAAQSKGNEMKFLIVSLALLVSSAQSFAHGGGLDKAGCHHNRKTGGYHCH
jgi:hypothetical protein